MLKTSLESSNFLSSFTHLIDAEYLDKQKKTKLDLFVINIDSNEFDFETLKTRLVDPVVDFALSRQIKQQHKKHQSATLSKKAREKFKQENNTGELGEFLLFCFLETHLNAPKILTKLEIKTSSSKYVNGSDGVHMLELDNGNYHVIYGESKTEKNLTTGIRKAIKSIYDFKHSINSAGGGKRKTGMSFEKTLICSEILKEAYSKKEIKFIKSLIYPNKENSYNVDTAFGVFLGYEIKVSQKDKKLSNEEFRKKVSSKIEKHIRQNFELIRSQITDCGLDGHHFYIYTLPFTDLKKNRENIMQDIIS